MKSNNITLRDSAVVITLAPFIQKSITNRPNSENFDPIRTSEFGSIYIQESVGHSSAAPSGVEDGTMHNDREVEISAKDTRVKSYHKIFNISSEQTGPVF